MSSFKLHIFNIIFITSILPNKSSFSQTADCNTCHKSVISAKIIHAPAEDCSSCHSPKSGNHPQTGTKTFTLTENMPALCYMCHDAKNIKKNIHPPVEDNCVTCHNPHSSDNKYLFKTPNVSQVCYECHESVVPQNSLAHNPVQNGECNKCHDPHQSNNSDLLKNNKPALCFSCHKNIEQISKFKNIHAPFDDNCDNCHQSHAAENKKLLSNKTPDLCFNCHNLQTNIQKAKTVHKPVISNKNCSNCHNPHGSVNKKMLSADGNNLCFTCHNKIIKTDKSETENIEQNIKQAKSIHVPVETDGCISCHNPHYSAQNFLLADKYPDKTYSEATPENYAFCFNCHDVGIITEKNTTSATAFRNKNKNMHFLHINGKKGRNCNLCHNIHASANEKLIKTKVKFGKWEMNMNFKNTNIGGSCFPGCHGLKTYNRN